LIDDPKVKDDYFGTDWMREKLAKNGSNYWSVALLNLFCPVVRFESIDITTEWIKRKGEG
jgi:hypothetical protein